MHKNPGNGLHVKVQERWVNRNRLQPKTSGEIQSMQARLEALLREAVNKSLKVAELMQMKAKETMHLQSQVSKAFTKNSEPQAHKVLVKANMELSNHLHHVERELGARRMEIKKIRSAAKRLEDLLRKKCHTSPRTNFPR